jgi:predicted Zn-dependent protease
MATYVAFSTDLGPHSSAGSYPSQSPFQRGSVPGRAAIDPVAAHRRFLDNAAKWLAASIKADPSIALAPLHLGRVLMLLDQDQRALKLLQGISASPTDTPTGYLADLFIGALHERRNRFDQAERAYRQALARVPGNQSAYLALSRVLQRSGRGDESREILNIVLLEPKRTTLEPWWWYLSAPPAQVRARITALRAVARK